MNGDDLDVTPQRLPGIGQPGSSPVTDATNRAIATAMDQADKARIRVPAPAQPTTFDLPTPTVDQLRSSLNPQDMIDHAVARRSSLLEGLEHGVDPDKPAIYLTPKRRSEMREELGAMHSVAMDGARQQHEDYLHTRNSESAQQFSNIVDRMRQIESPLGTPEHAKEVLKIAAENPLGAMTAAGRELLGKHSVAHDSAGSLIDEIKRNYPDFDVDTLQIPTGEKGHVTLKRKDAKTARVPSKTVADHTALLVNRAEQAQTLADATDAFNTAKDGSKEKTDAKKQLDDAEKSIRTIDAQRDAIYQEHPSLKPKESSEQPAEKPTQFDTEDAARSAGNKAGDVVFLKNPATGKYQKARLD